MDPAGEEGAATPADAGPVDGEAASGGGCGPISVVMLAIVLLVLGGVIGWAEDVAAPYVNEGEAAMPGPVEFTATEGTYVVITSGPLRPALEQTRCTITTADGRETTDRGSDGVEGGRTRFGVTRVLEFEAVEGPTSVRCSYTFDSSGEGDSVNGRLQVVRADTPVHLASLGLLIAGIVLLVAGIGWLVALFVRHRDQPAASGRA